MIIDCVARANPDLDMIVCSPMVLDEANNLPVGFQSATIDILSGLIPVMSVSYDSKYVSEDGRLYVTFNHPQYLHGLRAHVTVIDENGQTAEVTVDVKVLDRTIFAAKVLPTAPQPDDDEAID